MPFFITKDKEKVARKLAAKLSSFEYDIPLKMEKKILKEDFETFAFLIKNHFTGFTPPIQAKLRIIFDKCGYLDYLFSKLESNREEEIIEALEILGVLAPKKAFKPLVKCLQDKRDSINLEAAKALINLNDFRVIDYLIEELIHNHNNILPARIGHVLVGLASQAVPKLMDVFDELPPATQVQVIEIFVEINDKRTLPLIEKALLGGEPPVRVQAAAALGEIGGESSKTCLEKVAKDKDPVVKENARLALQQIAATRERGG